GDAALLALTARLDRCALERHRVDDDEFRAAEARLAAPVKRAIDEARARIARFHEAGAPQPFGIETGPGVYCERVLRPISPVGFYVPAGGAPLPSTVLMLAVPARIAGCRDIVLCSP